MHAVLRSFFLSSFSLVPLGPNRAQVAHDRTQHQQLLNGWHGIVPMYMRTNVNTADMIAITTSVVHRKCSKDAGQECFQFEGDVEAAFDNATVQTLETVLSF